MIEGKKSELNQGRELPRLPKLRITGSDEDRKKFEDLQDKADPKRRPQQKPS